MTSRPAQPISPRLASSSRSARPCGRAAACSAGEALLPPATRAFDRLTDGELKALEDAHRADRFHDECGVFAVHGSDEASHLTYLGLYALQHRGQESCGIVASNGREHVAP